ncbi:hypothetical protein [Dysgonomonas sp. 520]|uniref:hypothetical protein n=1 Tax=Dysgonomonas sp. 520 TaxID=2302931 RepID=UPI002102AC0A|nr:hypothetical protein [Dysgonomonas sp. 520]
MKKIKRIWHGFAFIAVFAAAIAIVMLLWNALIPSIIGWSAINYWQAAGLMILCRLLFSGFGRGRMHRHRHGKFGKHYFSQREKSELRDKLKGMSPDERREYIRNHMRGGFGRFCGEEGCSTPGETDNK